MSNVIEFENSFALKPARIQKSGKVSIGSLRREHKLRIKWYTEMIKVLYEECDSRNCEDTHMCRYCRINAVICQLESGVGVEKDV